MDCEAKSMQNKQLALLIAASILLFVSVAAADTWHLKKDQTWQPVPDDPAGRQMLAITKTKQLIAQGNTDAAQSALTQLQKDFPETAGPDLDIFLEAEILFSQAKWNKAAKKYNQLLTDHPDSWLYESTLERKYEIALAYLTGEKRTVLKVLKLSGFEEGEKMMRQIADRAGDAPIAVRSLKTLANAQGRKGKFLDAYETWAEISSKWPTGDLAREALLSMAQTLHSAYKGPRYDSASLVSARSYYRNFKLRYSDFAEQYKIDEQLATIEEQLAFKQFSTGQYYERAEKIQAANLYYQQVIEGWPDSKAAEMAKQAMQMQQSDQQPEKEKSWQRSLFDIGTTICDDSLSAIQF